MLNNVRIYVSLLFLFIGSTGLFSQEQSFAYILDQKLVHLNDVSSVPDIWLKNNSFRVAFAMDDFTLKLFQLSENEYGLELRDMNSGNSFFGQNKTMIAYALTRTHFFGINSENNVIGIPFLFIIKYTDHKPMTYVFTVDSNKTADSLNRLFALRGYAGVTVTEYQDAVKEKNRRLFREFHYEAGKLDANGIMVFDSELNHINEIFVKATCDDTTSYFIKRIAENDEYGFLWPIHAGEGLRYVYIPF